MATTRLEERFAYTGGRVDRTGGRPIVRDVLLCGPESANRRRYRKEAFAGDRVKKYDGRPVFLNHGDGRTGRRYEDRIAKVINPRLRADGMPIGDLEVRPKHPFAEAFLDDAEHDPKSVGMSHVAHCQTTRAGDGWEDVNAVESVESVDVVLDPATTKGLYESTGSRTVKISLKAFVERFGPKWGVKKWGDATKLVEDLGAMGDAPVMDAPADDATDGDLKSGLIAALMPLVEEAFESGNSDKAVSALKDFIKLHAKHTGKGGGDSTAADDTAAEEAKKKAASAKPDPWTVLAEAKAEFGPSYNPGPAELEALANLPNPTARKAYLAEQKAKQHTATDPKSTGRYQPLAAAAAQTTKAQEAVAQDTKSFLDRILE